MKIYISKDGKNTMLYDHEIEAASWGEKFYYVPFDKIKNYWLEIGDF